MDSVSLIGQGRWDEARIALRQERIDLHRRMIARSDERIAELIARANSWTAAGWSNLTAYAESDLRAERTRRAELAASLEAIKAEGGAF